MAWDETGLFCRRPRSERAEHVRLAELRDLRHYGQQFRHVQVVCWVHVSVVGCVISECQLNVGWMQVWPWNLYVWDFIKVRF